MNHDVFISYSSKNSAAAQAICHVLEDNNIKCWMAPRDIPVGAKYASVITQAIKECKAVVLIFSEYSAISPWVESEINIAFSNRRPIVPYKIDTTPLENYDEFYLMLNNRHWIEAYPDFKTRFADLVTVVSNLVDVKKSTVTQYITQPASIIKICDIEMVYVKGGTFTMGATSEQGSDAYSNEEPTHSVTLSDYYIGKYEVTQAQWRAVMGTSPSYFTGDNLPVEKVSWDDIQEFIQKLNEKTGKNFRLPTEAEWEYAARGGNKSNGYKYSGSNNIDDVAWYTDNSSDKTHPVGQKKPNELGIYDMSGNVWEWCQDWYGSYSSSSQTNPTGPGSGSYRVLRGGGWSYGAGYCRVSYRYSGDPGGRDGYHGFRLVCSPE